MKVIQLLAVQLLAFVFVATAAADDGKREKELDDYWQNVSAAVAAGEFESYAATMHPEGVLVNGIKGTSMPLKQALARWKEGIDATKAGELSASVEFRLKHRYGDETTAHETGIFLYSTQKPGEELKKVYIHFEALLTKKEGKWRILMEYQKAQATVEQWQALNEGRKLPEEQLESSEKGKK